MQMASQANRLLQALPQSEQELVRSAGRTLAVRRGEVLHEQGGPVRAVYFPASAMCSLTLNLESGDKAEVSTVGLEGFVGLNVFFRLPRAPAEALIQVPGEVLEVPADAFLRLAHSSPALGELLMRYAAYSLQYANQAVACNAFHSIEERACRWLLLTHDRVGDGRFELTHEFLAEMLGVTRQSVTLVARSLQRAGLIAYTRGRVSIVDRAGLEAAACECYAQINRYYRETVIAG